MNKSLSLLLGAALAFGSQLASASASGVVISQVYGGGGNGGAVYNNDFIELFNGGQSAVSIAGWSVQYASTTGSSWQTTPLGNVTLQPGQYYLVQEAAGSGTPGFLPTPDSIGAIAMSGTGGKVALVSSTAALNGATPAVGSYIDLVGYGGATYFEGTGPTPATANATAAIRKSAGCVDTDNNSADFTIATPVARNSASPQAPCGGIVNAPITTSCPAFSVLAGTGGSQTFTATDADGMVSSVVAGALPAGVTVGNFVPAGSVGGTASVLVSVAPSQPAGPVTVGLTFGNADGQTSSCSAVVTVTSGGGLTPIYSIQGSGPTSPLVGQTVTTSGVVTKVMNNGFFIQDPTGDNNPLTSDGVLVFTGATAPTVTAGQLIQVTATVSEFNTGAATNTDTASHTVTELTAPGGIVVLGSGSITPVTVTLPLAHRDDMEKYEGMLVTINGPLTVDQNYFLGRFGQLTISAGGRLETPTNGARPGAGANAVFEANARRSLILDDGSSLQNVNPTPYIGEGNTNRAGDTLATLTGVVDFGLTTAANTDRGSYRIQPVGTPVFTRSNPRTVVPDAVGGNIRLGSFNVLNFFTTFQNGQNIFGATGQGCSLGNSTSASNCRGANDLSEFIRQRDKIVAAIAALNPDAAGLMEIQNNGSVAVQYLVDSLNAVVGAGTYAVVPLPPQGTGTDAIRVAMIYQPARVTLSGPSTSDPAAINNRPPLAQTFTVPGGQTFTLVVNHLKSKGCDGASGADADQGDLQGCWNATRVSQAAQLRNFVKALFPTVRSPNVALVGDFNAYGQEDPIVAMTSNGYVDQAGRFSSFAYSYVFDGGAGRLDQALTSAALSSKVTGVSHWHINADEPLIIDYNNEFHQPACPTCGPDYYQKNPYRASDHDPVLIGLQLGTGPSTTGLPPAATSTKTGDLRRSAVKP